MWTIAIYRQTKTPSQLAWFDQGMAATWLALSCIHLINRLSSHNAYGHNDNTIELTLVLLGRTAALHM